MVRAEMRELAPADVTLARHPASAAELVALREHFAVEVQVRAEVLGMRIISFGWTTAALLAGRKTVTRRLWKAPYARRFHKGDLLAAYDRSPRIGGKHVATIRLTADPYLESTADAPPEDYAGEGFDYLTELGKNVDGMPPASLWRVWHWPQTAQMLWVVRFELVDISNRIDLGKQLLAALGEEPTAGLAG